VRGYSVTFYDSNTANIAKNLRRQSGRFYDQKKIRNSKQTLERIKPGCTRPKMQKQGKITPVVCELIH